MSRDEKLIPSRLEVGIELVQVGAELGDHGVTRDIQARDDILGRILHLLQRALMGLP